MWKLFIIAVYLIMGKDLLRFLEYYFSIPIPLNLISFTCVVVSIFVYLYDLRRGRLHFYHLVALHLIAIDFITLIVIISYKGFSLRDMVGVSYFHVLIPLFVVLVSNKLNFYNVFFTNKKLYPFVLFVLAAGVLQLACFKIFPDQSVQWLDFFYKNGWISWPFRISATGIYPRVVSIFYASFPFGLFVVFIYSVLVFSQVQRAKKILFSVLLVVLLFFTYNRNSYLAFGVVTGFKIISMMPRHINRAILASLFLVLLTFLNLFAPLIITNLPSSYFERSEDPFTKTTTVGSRVKAWNKSTKSLDADFLFGTGAIQGTKNTSTLADNFIIYKIQLNGLLLASFWFVFFLIIIWGVIKALLQYQPHSLLNAALLGSFFSMASFNIVFYEPLFQVLYLGTILSLLRGGGWDKSADNTFQ